LSPTKTEAKWQKLWEERQLYNFDEKDKKKPIYSIDTPPPFTSGDLHMGHVLSYAYFDFVARYKRMTGFNVYYPQGWDCQGFPTETKVEQKYGRKPPEEFRKLCVEWTGTCIERMRTQMQSLGFSADWRHQYRTMDPSYHKLVQKSILQMYDSGQIYRGEHPVFWCPSCRSALAKTDTEEAERQTQLHDIKFEIELDGGKKQELIIATTRPELMHACVAVLYHPSDERYNKLKAKHAITALGSHVPFKSDADVDPAFGSGVVMVCTFGDKQDVVWMYRHKLPLIRAMDERGKLLNAGDLSGLSVSDARAKLLERFKSEGKLLSSKPLQQVIKVHDRCKKPIELALSWQWFARITQKRDEIVKAARSMRWLPPFAISYLEDWANYVEWDWVISRQRVFGTPLPFWYCPKCDKSIPADEKELPVNPPTMEKKCPKCHGALTPETSTCDCWVDSSVSPLAISKWGVDDAFFSRTYPASLRPQGVEIVRTWAFYTIYRCQELTGKPPFVELLLNGNVLAPDGKKMSKSLGNIIAPDKLLTDYGADSIRIWAALSGAMAKDRPFSYQDIQYAKSFLHKLLNAGKLVQKAIEGYEPNEKEDAKHLRPIDKYFLHRLHLVVSEANSAWSEYEFQRMTKVTQEFFWHEFCDYYLEYVKYRIYETAKDKQHSRRAAQYTLYTIYSTVLKLLVPITPHASEELWQMFAKTKDESVHLQAYPKPGKHFSSADHDVVGLLLAGIMAEIRQQKSARKLPLNAPVKGLKLGLPREQAAALPHIEEELRMAGGVQMIECTDSDAISIEVEF
ncbi:MAG: valine--tRNA ligase, partial [Candidatus Marsarchaeota archaeon]|nr:valine--tRNA ligase [Candidatus Marsarchaeota archaeon]